LNASLAHQLNLTADHVPSVVALTIICTFCPSTLQTHGGGQPASIDSQQRSTFPTLPYIETTTNQIVTVQTADMLTGVTTVTSPTKARAVQKWPFLYPSHGHHYDHSSSNMN